MEMQNQSLTDDIENLKEKIAVSEEKVKGEDEKLEENKSARLTIESKMDAAFLKKVNLYFQQNAEIPVVNMCIMFVGMLRNDKDISRIDVELIFKTYGSFKTKLSTMVPADMNPDVLNHYAPQIEMYKKFIKNKDDVKIAKFVDFDGEFERKGVSDGEAHALIEEQRKVMGPFVYFLLWADAYLQQSRREVFKKKSKKANHERQRKINNNQKDIDHNKIILGNYQNDNLEENLA